MEREQAEERLTSRACSALSLASGWLWASSSTSSLRGGKQCNGTVPENQHLHVTVDLTRSEEALSSSGSQADENLDNALHFHSCPTTKPPRECDVRKGVQVIARSGRNFPTVVSSPDAREQAESSVTGKIKNGYLPSAVSHTCG